MFREFMRRKLGLFGCFSLLRVAVCAFVLLSVDARTFLVQCEKACPDVRFFSIVPLYKERMLVCLLVLSWQARLKAEPGTVIFLES